MDERVVSLYTTNEQVNNTISYHFSYYQSRSGKPVTSSSLDSATDKLAVVAAEAVLREKALRAQLGRRRLRLRLRGASVGSAVDAVG